MNKTSWTHSSLLNYTYPMNLKNKENGKKGKMRENKEKGKNLPLPDILFFAPFIHRCSTPYFYY